MDLTVAKGQSLKNDPLSVVGTEFDNGFGIDYNMGVSLVKAYMPDKDLTYITNFTIDTVHGQTQLIAKLANGVVDFTLKLERDVLPSICNDTVDQYIELTEDTSKEYKVMQKKWWFTVGILCMFAVGVLIMLQCLK